MIPEGQVKEVTVCNSNIKHYESLGYENLIVRQKITIPIEHLSSGSTIEVDVICDVCGEPGKSSIKRHNLSFNNGGKYACSPTCAHIGGKNKQTCLERHGVEHYTNREKSRETLFNNYGVYVPYKSEEIKNKGIQTVFENWGVSSFTQTEDYIIKTKETNQRKYGVDWQSQNSEIMGKIRKSWDNKTEEELQEINEKKEQTMMDKFGVYHIWSGVFGERSCDKTVKEKYGVDHFSKTEEFSIMMKDIWKNKSEEEIKEIVDKRIETCLDKYGVESVLKNEEIYEKFKQTLFKNYGVIIPYHSEEIKNRGEQTCLDKYGVTTYSQTDEFIELMKNIWINRTEEEKQEIINKMVQTNLERFGVEHPSQNTEIFNKQQRNSYMLKDYKLPSGNIIKIQGYEPLALDILLKTYDESDLLISNKNIENKIGQIWYKDGLGNNHRYVPDIYIISENKIIEVKSTWTYQNKIDNIFLKQQRCLDMGMKFEFIVFNGNKKLLSEGEVKNLIK